jgi:hypothetical protein
MLGRLKSDQGQLFYEFRLRAVPRDHLVRKIDAVLDLCYGTERRSPSRSRNEIATNWAKRP